MREPGEQGSLHMHPKQWLNRLNLRTGTSPWMGWACSEAQGGDVRQHIRGDVLCSLGSGGRQPCWGLQGKVKGRKAGRLVWLWITKLREVKQGYFSPEAPESQK